MLFEKGKERDSLMKYLLITFYILVYPFSLFSLQPTLPLSSDTCVTSNHMSGL